MNAPTAPKSLSALKNPPPAEAQMPAVSPGFGSLQSFELALRQANLLSSSTLVPAQYRQFVEKKDQLVENGNAIPNCVIAMNMAQRMGADPLMVMQNLYIVEGRPSWSSQWIIAAINGCGRFSPLRFDMKDLGEKEVSYTTSKWIDGTSGRRQKVDETHKTTIRNLECVAWAVEKGTNERITSPAVTMEMAVKEGWYGKNGSKWQTMPEVMLRYRTASFFGKLYAPELLMGLQSVEDMQDAFEAKPDGAGGFVVDVESLRGEQNATPAAATPGQIEGSGAGTPCVAEESDGAGEASQGGSADQSAEGAAPTTSAAQQSQGNGAPTFEDAMAEVKAGNVDAAKDIARSLPDGQRAQIETAIANRSAQSPQSAPASRRRTGSGPSVE